MKTPAWYKGITPNFKVNKYMWVNDSYRNFNGNLTLVYSERVDVNNCYTNFGENRETEIAGEASVRLCTADEITEIKRMSGSPVVINHYSIF